MRVTSRGGPVWAGVDGEMLRATDLSLTVAPRALTVVVPDGFDARRA
ncbi:hypothetical protein DAETH_46450 (plasmid) [Deinococcus aetherius]|uniref:Diacylglycerol kinase n=1 Tax=Deinococcus aetherius TaxID=200252 RepID=A0ABM8ALG0_9DEIO|nr:hypothetical protein DAETH_46450 [Deinococcus aetherius]